MLLPVLDQCGAALADRHGLMTWSIRGYLAEVYPQPCLSWSLPALFTFTLLFLRVPAFSSWGCRSSPALFNFMSFFLFIWFITCLFDFCEAASVQNITLTDTDALVAFSTDWQMVQSNLAPGGSFEFANGVGATVDVFLPVNTVAVSYFGFQRSNGASYAACLNCASGGQFQLVDAYDSASTETDPPVNLFSFSGLDATAQQTLTVINLPDARFNGQSQITFAYVIAEIENGRSPSTSSLPQTSVPTSTSFSTSSTSISLPSSSTPTAVSPSTSGTSTTSGSSWSSTETASTSASGTTSSANSSTSSTTVSSVTSSSTTSSQSTSTTSSSPVASQSSASSNGVTQTRRPATTLIAIVAVLSFIALLALLVGAYLIYRAQRRKKSVERLEDIGSVTPYPSGPPYGAYPYSASMAGRKPSTVRQNPAYYQRLPPVRPRNPYADYVPSTVPLEIPDDAFMGPMPTYMAGPSVYYDRRRGSEPWVSRRLR